MANQIPLVLIAGQVQQIPSGDTISTTIAPGSGGSPPPYHANTISADLTIPTGNSMVIAEQFSITSTAALIVQGTSIVKIL